MNLHIAIKTAFLFCYTIVVFGKSTDEALDSLISAHKVFDILKAEKINSKTQPLLLKQLFTYDLEFLKNGTIVNIEPKNLNRLKGKALTVAKYILADLLVRQENGKDSIAFINYIEAYNESLVSNDKLVLNEVLRRICNFLFSKKRDTAALEKYLEIYMSSALDSTDNFFQTYYEIGRVFLEYEKNISEVNNSNIDTLFICAKKWANTYYLKGKYFHFKSIFHSAYLNNQKLANRLNKRAIENYQNYPFHFAHKAIRSIRFNDAVIMFENGQYQAAIVQFEEVLKDEKKTIYRMYGYDWLHKCYDSLGDYGNAYRYFKKVGEAKDSLSLLEHAREIKVIEAQYDFAEKERELEHLANEKNRVQNNFNTLVPFFGIALILVLVALFLYRKYRRRSELLEEEKTETLKRIHQLKKIVIKNHIVLKDKTKVYIADLVYIKAEDHYLKLFLSDNKDHLVRGKIKAIKKQLPPNFIQCHRSYIVNANFIKQANRETLVMMGGAAVPLSRTYKDNF